MGGSAAHPAFYQSAQFKAHPGAVAYWKLDGTEGDIAHDSAAANDGTVHGDPAWHPDGGIVDGALQFDGIDDYVSADFVLNPAERQRQRSDMGHHYHSAGI